ncbi:MAG: signal peptide peptidase SppA [Cyanobacteria bacterium SIG29]|nr:signal peptide peptidase SppA [Cyanobacteria bacterium SIG29]
MKESIISKIVIILCICCLCVGFINMDKDRPYNKNENNNAISKTNVISTVNKVAVLELDGPIATTYESNFFSKEANAQTLLESLISLQTNNDIKGIIIKINSPGGTVAMSQNIYNQIIKIRKKKPVVVVLDDVAASGGYYIASAADRIIAQEGTLTGSIGVIFSFMDYHNLLLNKLSVKPVVIKSGKHKDIGSGLREITQEEIVLMQEIIDDSYKQFVEAIVNGRINRTDKYSAKKTNLTMLEINKYADGRVFTGKQAQKMGFVDEIGDLDTAKDMIEKMLQEKLQNKQSIKLVRYNKKNAFSEYFSTFKEYSSNSNIKLTDFIPTSMILSRKPLYLWE